MLTSDTATVSGNASDSSPTWTLDSLDTTAVGLMTLAGFWQDGGFQDITGAAIAVDGRDLRESVVCDARHHQ